ncbi:MAG: hypothetical protein Q4D04_06240 [Clostridia bacterium]|nr:hypothetical protein [Clostridia bacterium]
MIQVILGKRGSGKTKRLIDLANDALKSGHECIVFVDDDKRYMYDLRHEIRFVNAGEFALGEHRSMDWFYGLLGGMLAVNFDISIIYVDAFAKLINNTDWDETEELFQRLESLSRLHNADLVLSVSGDPETIPEFITRYAV